MKARMLGFIGIMAILAAPVGATVITKYFEEPVKQGQARFKYLFWNVYDATLYLPANSSKIEPPFALELTYLRDLDGEAIAERSVKEMRQQGNIDETKLKEWEALMKGIFPNVTKGSAITGIADSQKHSHFYYNGEKVAVVMDPEFTERFFNIWLGDNTSEPEFRDKLLNEDKE